MAENETSAPEQDLAPPAGQDQPAAAAAEEQPYQYNVRVEDAGPATKKVFVEIPAERIGEKLKKQFKELRAEAQIPGFRPGHAPQKLVEKRFATDVREQVRRALVSESYEQALESNKLTVIGEPEFEDAEKIQLPDNGPLTYSFQVEVQPEIKLPEVKGLKVKKPKIEVKDENVDQAMSNLREQQGALVPVEGRGVEAKDFLVADVHVKVDGNVISHQHDAQLVSRPGRIGGIQVDDLEQQLAGLKSGEKRDINTKIPDTFPTEDLRGKDAQIEISLKDLKRLELAELNAEFLAGLGFVDEAGLRAALREQMEERIGFDIQRSMREQVIKYLLDNVNIDLPAKVSDRQVERIASRRMMDLMQRGIGADAIQSNLETLRSGAKEEAARELKLFFILQQVATEQGVDISEGELNGRVAMLAAQRGRRPEKMKQEMSKDGSLAELYVQMREQKAVDKILEQAEIEEVEVKADEAKAE